MHLSLPWNLISSISAGWSPVSGIISQSSLIDACTGLILRPSPPGLGMRQYSVATQLMYVSALYYDQYIKILTCVCLSVSDGSGMFVGRD